LHFVFGKQAMSTTGKQTAAEAANNNDEPQWFKAAKQAYTEARAERTAAASAPP
jgi:hypothetical protein